MVAVTAKGDSNKAIEVVAQRVLARPLSKPEKSLVKQSLGELMGFYAQQPDEAKKLIAVGESKPAESLPAPQLAALMMVANQLLNLDEALNK